MTKSKYWMETSKETAPMVEEGVGIPWKCSSSGQLKPSEAARDPPISSAESF